MPEEKEDQYKKRISWAVTLFATFLTFNGIFGGSNSSRMLYNVIEIGDLWSFYQARSIKQSLVEIKLYNETDLGKIAAYKRQIQTYESEPSTGEGKKELFEKATGLQKQNDELSKNAKFFSYTTSILQIVMVMLSTSLLAKSRQLYYAALILGIIGFLSFTQAMWLWIPLPF